MKNKNQKDSKPASRKLYQSIDQSRTFEDWVNKLELKNSYFFSFLVYVDSKFSLKNLGIWAIFSLCFSFLLFAKFDYQNNVNEGEIATVDIKSPMNFTMVDILTTDSKKEVARKNVLSVFKYIPLDVDMQLDQIYTTFLKFRRLSLSAKNKALLNKEDFEKSLGQKISDRTFEWLLESRFSPDIDSTLRAVIENWSSQFLADSPERHILPNQRFVTLLNTYKDRMDETKIPVDSMKDIYRRSVLKEDVPMRLNNLSKINQKKVLDLAFDLLRPNVVYDAELTEKRRKAAVDEILPATISIKKNQTIITAGSIVSLADVKIVNHIRKIQYESKRGFVPVTVAFLFLLFIVVAANLIGAFKAIERNLDYRTNILFLVAIICLAFWKIFLFVFEASLGEKFGSYPQEVLLLASPFVAPIIISGLITRSPYLLFMFTMFTSIAFAFLNDQDFSTFVIISISSFAAIRTIYNCEKRNDVYISASYSGMVAFFASIIFLFVNEPESLTSIESWLLLFGAAFVGSALSSVLTFILVPIIESAFEFSTDLKLLDLASMNHPIIREMMVKAPGTYHHSMVVGSMCEAAAREVGADALMNKVMGYFHDIGKLEHPTYFIENQRQGENPHDHISPNLSKTIIMAHIKDGVEMAIKAKLGQEIIDGIKQHHGTTLVSYFYNRAKKIAENPDDVKEEQFRYAGPKPQFKESAILMLADSIEAAARSMEDPNPAKLGHLVENMIEKKIMDSQLDECDLNFVELTMIKKSFYRTILGVYHHRVDYKETDSQKKVIDKSANA